jgi:hypothetical protein
MPDQPVSAVPQDMLGVVGEADQGSVDYSSMPVDQLLSPTDTDPLAPTKDDTKTGQEGSGGLTVEAVQKHITDATAPLLQANAELKQQIQFLLGGMAQQRQQQAPPAVQQPSPNQQPVEFTYDYDALGNEMQTNAPKALAKFGQDYINHKMPEIKEEIRKELLAELNGQFTRRDQVSATHQAQIRDAQRAASEYPEVLANENGAVKFLDNDFANEAGQEFYNNILVHTPAVEQQYQAGDKNWGSLARPGDFYAAIATVAARRLKQGKYPVTNDNTNGKPSLRQVINRSPAQDPNGPAPRGGPAKTIDEFFKTPQERTFAHRYHKSLGISEEAYVKQCAAAAQLEI